jgi:hypothetical protein
MVPQNQSSSFGVVSVATIATAVVGCPNDPILTLAAPNLTLG